MKFVVLLGALTLAGCVASEDTGVQAAKMMQQDDATCRSMTAGKGEKAYQDCRQNLLGYRQQAMAEQREKQARLDRIGDGLAEAGRAMQDLDRHQDVTVNCFGCRTF